MAAAARTELLPGCEDEPWTDAGMLVNDGEQARD
jgi:hypothetical protein